MDTALKSPCLECDHHLAGRDKNCDQCKNCEKRLVYVNAIGTCPGESVNEGVSLEGGGGGSENKKSIIDAARVDAMVKAGVEDLPGSKSKEDPATKEDAPESDKADSIETHIEHICAKNGWTLEQIRTGVKMGDDKSHRKEFHRVRNLIIEFLSSGQAGQFTQNQIGSFLNISGATICALIKNYRIPTPTKTRKKKQPAPPAPVKEKSPETPPVKPMTLTFDKHPDLYHDIVKLAEEKLRKPENQVLWILLKIQERGLAIPEG